MEISEKLKCLFNAELTECNGSYVIEVPTQEFTHGSLAEHKVYRIAMLTANTDGPTTATTDTRSEPARENEQATPPVSKGETREVEITALGDQGDGIAKVERGYVIIVPGASVGETVTIEIVHIADSYAIGEVVDAAPTGESQSR